MAYNKPAIFKTAVVTDLSEAQSCIRFAETEHTGELRAATKADYLMYFRENARLMRKALYRIVGATGQIERADVVLIPEESQFERARKRFQRLDRNNDQRITFDEWMAEELEEAA